MISRVTEELSTLSSLEQAMLETGEDCWVVRAWMELGFGELRKGRTGRSRKPRERREMLGMRVMSKR